MDNVITSRQNNLVKHVKALSTKKYRDQWNEFFVEGIKGMEEAVSRGAKVKYILIREDFNWEHSFICKIVQDNKIPYYRVSKGVFDSMSDTRTPQGITAVIGKPAYDMEQILNRPSFFLTILDGVQDPGNVGTIIRTMDGAGGDGVVLFPGCADPYNPKTVRSTMGSIFTMPIFYVEDKLAFLNKLIGGECHVMVSHLDGENLFNWKGGYDKVALVIGNESKGVSEAICTFASSMVKIPIIGDAESLNASVAAGILIYHIINKCYYM